MFLPVGAMPRRLALGSLFVLFAGCRADVNFASLLDTVYGSFPERQAEEYLASIQRDLVDATAKLTPILEALPRTEDGKFAPPVVRYALNRFFIRQYGWHILGLENTGSNMSTADSSLVVLERLPPAARNLFAQSAKAGMPKEDIFMFAATLEYLIHLEATDAILTTVKALNISRARPMPVKKAYNVVEVYLAGYLLAEDLKSEEVTANRAKMMRSVTEYFPAWSAARLFVHEEMDKAMVGRIQAGTITVEELLKSVEGIGHWFGHWQADVCTGLKKSLTAIEDRGSGTVLLSDFYSSALNNGKWEFAESIPYLRKLGALDETDKQTPRVLIPNWINGPSNCIGTGRYHNTCCPSECEALMASVESFVGQPTADPDELSAFVSKLASESVPAGRVLDEVLVHRLHGIAHKHGGRVPISGRLFAQWMHHAYPRECSFPHMAGTTQPVNVFDFEALTGSTALATPEVMSELSLVKKRHTAPLRRAPWLDEEELLTTTSATEHLGRAMLVHFGLALTALGAMTVALVRTALRAMGWIALKDKKVGAKPPQCFNFV